MLNKPDPSYHGAVWTEAVKPLGPIAYIIKARVTLLRDIGASMSPVQRVPVHPGAGDPAAAHRASIVENADKVVDFLSKQQTGDARSSTRRMQTGEEKRRADTYLKGGYGGAGRVRAQGRHGRRARNSSTR